MHGNIEHENVYSVKIITPTCHMKWNEELSQHVTNSSIEDGIFYEWCVKNALRSYPWDGIFYERCVQKCTKTLFLINFSQSVNHESFHPQPMLIIALSCIRSYLNTFSHETETSEIAPKGDYKIDQTEWVYLEVPCQWISFITSSSTRSLTKQYEHR